MLRCVGPGTALGLSGGLVGSLVSLVGGVAGEGGECYSSACITQQQWGTAGLVTASGLMGEPGLRFTLGHLSITLSRQMLCFHTQSLSNAYQLLRTGCSSFLEGLLPDVMLMLPIQDT